MCREGDPERKITSRLRGRLYPPNGHPFNPIAEEKSKIKEFPNKIKEFPNKIKEFSLIGMSHKIKEK